MEAEIMVHEVASCSSAAPSESQEASPGTTDSHKNRGAQLLGRRKQLSAFLAPSNPYQLSNTYSRRVTTKASFPHKLDAVTQRVLSGKEHKIKQLENELGVTRMKICELTTENRLLRSLNKRNNSVLSRFQDVEAELPSLLSFHNAEMKALRERFQKLSLEHREQARELRSKDQALQSSREQVATLTKLSEEKGLRERHQLTTSLEEAREKMTELEEQHKTATRQLMLERKSFKHQAVRQQKKYQELKAELDKALENISVLESKLKAKEKFVTNHLTRKEFHQSGRSFSSFKAVSLGSEPKARPVGASGAIRRLQTSSTVRSSASDLKDEDDIDSELSFSQNMAPSIDSMMNHLHYSSSDTDEEVSQIYRARPTSVPQLALHTSASTPWAVDSRTFSIRTSDSHTTHLASATTAPVPNSPLNKQTTPPDVASPRLDESMENKIFPGSASSKISVPETSDNVQKNSEDKDAPAVEAEGAVLSHQSSSTSTEISEIASNYSKEALLAALKAIDEQKTSGKNEDRAISLENGPMKHPFEEQNHTGKKTELMKELFGSDNSKTISTDVPSEF